MWKLWVCCVVLGMACGSAGQGDRAGTTPKWPPPVVHANGMIEPSEIVCTIILDKSNADAPIFLPICFISFNRCASGEQQFAARPGVEIVSRCAGYLTEVTSVLDRLHATRHAAP